MKSIGLSAKRGIRNLIDGLKTFPASDQLTDAPVIAVSRSGLWPSDDTEMNKSLTSGKVQNLRIAARRLHAIEVDANQIFSFWQQIGNPASFKGYVIGRELREGCIIPTIAGGLCQLSNALYDAALQAGFEILERHRHTQVIPGSLAEKDRDATVKYNYLDLRFRSAYAFRIEVDLTDTELIVRLRSFGAINKVNLPETKKLPVPLNDCLSCGHTECHRHSVVNKATHSSEVTAYIVDEPWPEHLKYIRESMVPGDNLIVRELNEGFKTKLPVAGIRILRNATLQRSLLLRLAILRNQNLFNTALRLDRKVALAVAAKIPSTVTHLVVSQNLLPFLWEAGVLGGRTFDVLMSRLPIQLLQEQLDHALNIFPDSLTLNDYRASQTVISSENAALTRARYIVTPHTQIAAIFHNKCIRTEWLRPSGQKTSTRKNKILFPGSAVARKGANEIKRLAQELNLSIVYTGKATEFPDFWQGVDARPAGTDVFDNIGLVVYPAYVEHQPRILLKAIAAGISVVTTENCGIPPQTDVHLVPCGDYEYLRKTVSALLSV